jgi:hypothetical protein
MENGGTAGSSEVGTVLGTVSRPPKTVTQRPDSNFRGASDRQSKEGPSWVIHPGRALASSGTRGSSPSAFNDGRFWEPAYCYHQVDFMRVVTRRDAPQAEGGVRESGTVVYVPLQETGRIMWEVVKRDNLKAKVGLDSARLDGERARRAGRRDSHSGRGAHQMMQAIRIHARASRNAVGTAPSSLPIRSTPIAK